MKKPYTTPVVELLGTVEELTAETPGIDKCSGSGDVAFPQILQQLFQADCP